MKDVKHKKTDWYKELQNTIKRSQCLSYQNIDLAYEKGAFLLVNFLALAEGRFVLKNKELHDAICLRYN